MSNENWQDELGMRAFEAAMWKKWKQEEGNPIELEDDAYEAWQANAARYCHENGLAFPISGEAMIEEMRDLEATLSEQVAEKDCPLCPEWAEEKFKIGYDDFGGICQIDGVACCDTCYRVYHLTHPYEESNE